MCIPTDHLAKTMHTSWTRVRRCETASDQSMKRSIRTNIYGPYDCAHTRSVSYIVLVGHRLDCPAIHMPMVIIEPASYTEF